MQINADLASLAARQAIAPSPVSQPTPNVTAVRDAVNAINQSELLGFDRELKFSTDQLSRVGIVQVLSRSTGEVILQIPSELILDLAQNL